MSDILVITLLVLILWIAGGFVFCTVFHLLKEKYVKNNEEDESVE